jgi:hypothetical protein
MADLEKAGVKIFFKAPNPKKPGSETMTIDKNPAEGANFQWVAYQLLFHDGDNYFIYSADLKPDGSDKGLEKVFESDSAWSGTNKNKPILTGELSSGSIKRMFPELLKGPELHPSPENAPTVEYINVDPSNEGKTYSTEEFKKNFNNNFYVVLSPGVKKLNPFGVAIGMDAKKAEVMDSLYMSAVRLAKEKKDAEEDEAMTGGFDIMKQVFKHPVPIKKGK